MDHVERFEIPTPFQIGKVNSYLITAGKPTLLDPGPSTTEAYGELTEQLDGAGYALEDIERVLITHPHMDHFGICHRIRAESGAQIYCHEDARELLTDPDGCFEREQQFFVPFLQRMGVPEQSAESAISLPEPYTDFREAVTVYECLTDGDRLDVGLELDVVYTPGHSPGSVCYVDPAHDAAFTGDHIMNDISPNPLLTLVPGTTDERTRSLPMYLESLRRMKRVDATVAYGGHREPVSDLNARIDEIVDHHQERKQRIATLIDEHGGLTAYEVMEAMFPDLPMTEIYPGMSEVIGHLDLLEDDGTIVRSERDGVWYYELA
ncbi:MBL fold metallo-hydrolase [Natrinema halophilum]|uniref:MBL fold metallo-hydrolase n=1 Tax=Natrinema halophilum TaxID=1699371 RepID=UPI001F260457|nr:MBL fold metallo-hydrolase [Natrinema halophilum]UHQ96196.1 MBL fold metallo-hydrolase [Natrinema halophilum]